MTPEAQSSSKDLRIVGAGFSGLTLAYFLLKLQSGQNKFKITVVESSSSVGGLLQTVQTPYGPVEKAANALLDSDTLREIAQDIGLELLEAPSNLKRAFFLRDSKLVGWPLKVVETFSFLSKVFKNIIRSKKMPESLETLDHWAKNNLGEKASLYLLEPALGGIYASSLENLSARLIMARFLGPKAKTTRKKKILSVAPKEGMNEVAQKLKTYLESQGVSFEFAHSFTLEEHKRTQDITVFCGSLKAAQNFLKPKKIAELDALEMISVSKSTLFFEKGLSVKAFGILYPRPEKRLFLGTLLDNCIFPSRYSKASETWIQSMGKAERPDERKLLNEIYSERKLLFSSDEKAIRNFVTFWEDTLPSYNVALERFLTLDWPQIRDELKRDWVYLHGNYLGKLGLSQILLSSKELAEELVERHLK